MKSRRTEKGTVIVIAAILLPILLAGLGLVIDNGQAMDMKRRLQKAADAGALAAAHEIRRNNVGQLHQIALDNIKLNGFSLPDTNIQVFNPPKTGKRAGDKDFVEVVLRHEAPLYFMKAFYQPQVNVEARAIGGVIPQEICMLALNKTASPGLLVSGSAYVDVRQCGVQVNSSSNQAARSNGANAALIAASIDVVGKYTGVGFQPTPQVEQPYVEDPLAKLPPPKIGKCQFTSLLKVATNMTLNPGTYCGGISVSSGATATLNPGTYVLKGGLSVQGGGTIKGDGVTIYNTGSPYAPINIGGGALAILTAPTSGTYKGILFFTDRTISDGKPNHFTAGGLSKYTGTLYFPTTPFLFIGNADLLNQKMLIIADTIEFQGNCTVTLLSKSDASPFAMDAVLVY